MSTTDTITVKQAEHISMLMLERFHPDDRSHAFNKMHKHFGIDSFSKLPSDRYDEAIAFIQGTELPGKQAEGNEIRGVANIANVTRELWNRVNDSLHPDEHRWFAKATENALLLLENLSETLDGIANHVANDTKRLDGIPETGAFQSRHDLPNLLYGMAESIRTAQALAMVGKEAAHYAYS
ncbi:MAG: hypothetical protein FWG26_00190 [Betaproteobacteria bacterium]|nr:hypothetical protein [Betaproteobacteria bacterium]